MRVLAWVSLVAACNGGQDDGGTDGADTDAHTDGPAGDAQAVLRVLGYEVSNGVFGAAVHVDFYRQPQPFQADLEATIPIDTCEVTLYDAGPTTPPGTTPSDARPSAGLVAGALDGQPLSFLNGTADLEAWPVGQTVSFSASGAEVPAFDVPALLVVPEAPLSASSRTLPNDFVEVTWSGSPTASPPVVISIAGSLGVVECSAADDGEFVVPDDGLDAIAAGDQVLLGRSLVVTASQPGVTVTGWAYVTADAD